MNRRRFAAVGTCVAWLAAVPLLGGEPAVGWRGNGTGLWPEATVPKEWHRIAHGALEGLRASADRPADAAEIESAPLVEKGLLPDWLVLGPFSIADSVADFDADPLGGATSIEPALGTTTAGQTWTAATVPPDDVTVFGTAELPWLDLVPVVGFRPNQFAYAHTYLYSPRGGRARVVVQHGHGLQAWLNGAEVYRSTERQMLLGYYPAISRYELDYSTLKSPRFDVELRPGWNRLLVKLSTSNREDWTDMRLNLRIADPPDVEYESKNIAWMTELPGRSTSTPIVVGDRLFVMAEPDELLCLDKHTGRVLWTRANNYYECLTAEERAALPALADSVDPLVAELRGETDRDKRIELRAAIQAALLAIDPVRFGMIRDDHFDAHFGIVGFTMPTPVSDGERVYVLCGMGVAACYDLDGNRTWIERITRGPLTYGSSPALADGVLAVFLGELMGLDAETGEIVWEQPRVRKNVAAIMAARLRGEQVFITHSGEIVRAADGELLFRPEGYTSGDTGWAPPVVQGERLYQPKYGVNLISVLDFAAEEAALEEPLLVGRVEMPGVLSRRPDGGWLDRWTAGSPLVWQDLAYEVDMYQMLHVYDLAAGQPLYHEQLDLRGFTHYNALAVAASPTLVGEHIVVLDNQGTALVLKPGREFNLVARNRIETVLERDWPLPAQETLAYAPPIVDGGRMYLRGERYLYCVAEE